MHRSKLKNNFNKKPTEENKILYEKQRNYCGNLLKKRKKSYYNNLDLKVFEDNKEFWKSIIPLFSEKKNMLQRNIMILDIEKIFTGEAEVAEKLNNFFIETVESLHIDTSTTNAPSNDYTDEIEEIRSQYQTHHSILKIKEHITLQDEGFKFKDINSNDIYNGIIELDPKKASIKNDIPAKILIESNEIVSSSSLKLGIITPIQKKVSRRC